MDNHFIDLRVDYFTRDGGFWFASLQVGRSVSNAPGGSRGQAVLQAWSSYTDQQTVLASVYAAIREQHPGERIPAWPSRFA